MEPWSVFRKRLSCLFSTGHLNEVVDRVRRDDGSRLSAGESQRGLRPQEQSEKSDRSAVIAKPGDEHSSKSPPSHVRRAPPLTCGGRILPPSPPGTSPAGRCSGLLASRRHRRRPTRLQHKRPQLLNHRIAPPG